MAGILGTILGAGVAEPIKAVGNVLDGLFTSDEEKLSREEAKLRLLQAPDLAQVELNKIEAQHRSVFVAGWRPAVGWICAFAVGWTYIGRDIVAWASDKTPPALAVDGLMELLILMLGFGAYRSLEKFGGRSK